MARWNLAHAASLVGGEEAARWRSLAADLVDGFDVATGRHEQFAGYFGLEPLTVADLPPAADPVDVLGWGRVQRAQLIKQADVLMLHLLVPALAGAGTLAADIEWYEPRTTHASSLSHPVHAAALARAGQLDGALSHLRQATTIDLDDREGRTHEGLHVAAMGGVWHALIHGIAGLELHGQNLHLHPHLPADWEALEFQVVLHGAAFRIRVLSDRVVVRSHDGRLVRVGGHESWVEVAHGGVELEHDALGWRASR